MCIRDRRNRVVAAGVDTSLPVSQVMSADPATGSADALAFQILMEMTSRNIHHLPILGCDGTPEGVVTTTDPVSYTHLDVYKRQWRGWSCSSWA